MVLDYHFDPNDQSIKNGKVVYAIDNVKHLIADVELEGVRFARDEAEDERGYFGFVLWKGKHACPIMMPGSPLYMARHMPPDNPTTLNRPLDIGLYYDRFKWWNGLVGILRKELSGNGYNPAVAELEHKVELLQKELSAFKKSD